MLQESLAKWCDADVIIYVGCGERGNELTDLIAELALDLDRPHIRGLGNDFCHGHNGGVVAVVGVRLTHHLDLVWSLERR